MGSSWLHAEPVHKSSNAGEIVTGWPAEAPCWAMPMRSFGRVVGILTVENAHLPANIEEWATMLDSMAHSWDTVGRLEDHLAYQQQTEELLVNALESMPYYRTGHVNRVSQTANELGRLLDLSAHQRQRLQRAGRYHDVGLLISAADHTRAGADFLRNGKVHADLASLVENHHQIYSESLNLGLEEWALALAEHFQEFCESLPGESADALVQRFATQHGNRHNPAVLDALIGLSVAGNGEILPRSVRPMKWPWGMTGYQWAVVFAAWLGWGFDIIDALLFNDVAENCIPTLLHLPRKSPEALAQTRHYTGLLTSVLLLGWAAGGILMVSRQNWSNPDFASHHCALLYRHSPVRPGAQCGVSHFLPNSLQPWNWWRMGRRCSHGGRSGAPKTTGRGRSSALHLGPLWPDLCSRHQQSGSRMVAG